MSTNIERPSFVQDKHLTYLDSLRESGITNMFRAAPYMQATFHMPIDKARATLSYWMQTFAERHESKS